MSVALYVNNSSFRIGNSDFLNSFFSTISYHLEPKGWGSRFPVLMDKLYSGEVEYKNLHQLSEELESIKEELANYPPEQIIWDIEVPQKSPPWGKNISTSITSLANYFVTDVGEDLFDVLSKAIQHAQKKKSSIRIE